MKPLIIPAVVWICSSARWYTTSSSLSLGVLDRRENVDDGDPSSKAGVPTGVKDGWLSGPNDGATAASEGPLLPIVHLASVCRGTKF